MNEHPLNSPQRDRWPFSGDVPLEPLTDPDGTVIEGATPVSMLRDRTRPPGTPPHMAHVAAEVLALTRFEPSGEVTHWTGRAVARAVGIPLRSVQRIWDAHRFPPHRVRTFKRSHDPAFAEKVEDTPGSSTRAGLYMDPPAHAAVPSIDEKGQIQALQRTRPGLPPTQRHSAAQTRDYIRHSLPRT